MTKMDNRGQCLDYQLTGGISQVEKEILGVILKFNEKKRQFTFKNLLKACKSQLNYPIEEIFFNLQELYKRKILVEDSQLVKVKILESPNRKLIYQLIMENPGVQLSDLIKLADIPLQTCSWHIAILKRFEMIKTIQYKNRYCFGNVNISDNHLKIYNILKNKINKIILKEISQNPLITLSAISEKLKMALSTLHYHINELKTAGLISISMEGSSQFLKISSEIQINQFF